MNTQTDIEKFFTVAFRTQTYSNLLYLLLSFPLGIFYFTFLVTGVSLGIGLAIVWVGVLILGLVIAAWVAMGAFERQMAIGMLNEKIPPMKLADRSNKTLWQQFTGLLGSPATWKSLVYLLLKFPLGIFNFVALVTLLSISLAFVTLPLYYQWVTPQINFTVDGAAWNGIWFIDTPVEAALACLFGLALFFLSLHVLNGLAWFSGRFARIMLGDTSPAPAAVMTAPVPAAPTQPEVPSSQPPQPPAEAPFDPSI